MQRVLRRRVLRLCITSHLNYPLNSTKMSSLSSDMLINPQDLFDITVSTAGTSTVWATNNEAATLGALATTGDGRYFRYAIAGATALVAGNLQQGPVEITGNEALTVAAAVAGATSVTTVSTVTVVANQLTGGYMAVTESTGVGYLYKIAGNTAATGAVTTITLEDPLQTALAASTTQIDLIPNPYNRVIINPTSATGLPVGVAVTVTPAYYYGWLQVRGVCNVLADGAITVGTALVASNGAPGAVEPLAGVQAIVGTAVTGIATTDYGAVNLCIG